MSEKIRSSRSSFEGVLLAGVLFLIAIAAMVLAGRRWLPPLASEHGAGIDRLMDYLMVSVGSLFILGHLILGIFIWRFSRQDRVTYRQASPRTERMWALVPALVMTVVAEGGVLVMGLPVWGKLYGRAAPPDAFTVEVTGEQFAWNVRYPGPDGRFGRTDPSLIADDNPLGIDRRDPAARDDIVHLGVVHVPVNRPVRVRLRSKDTLHSFFIPHFRLKQDAVPGMTIEVWFVPTQVGEYEIACAELCGFGHFQMRGLLRVLSPEQFSEWMARQQ
ncbi:MAG TPA: cytochrome c oxidase subunit II transmembrane domain-containing protein [Blastocatellia bacterium]|nr:cytochrome c oxidase subunit II transmembrane domain-containing protein [Blastocatellia bacterium]